MPPRPRSRPIRVGLYLSQIEKIEGCDESMTVEMAREAEAAGFDDVFLGEHLANTSTSERDRHLRTDNVRGFGGDWGHRPAMPWLDVTVGLAAVAGATRNVRLVANAMIAPLRNHLASAKALSSLDTISRGRLVVHPAPSWQPGEYAAAGVDFHSRGRRLDDVLGAWHALWGPSPAAYESPTISFSDMYCHPKPYGRPAPALWFGAASMHDRLIARIVKWGSGMCPLFPPTPEDWTRLERALAEAERAIDEIEYVTAVRPVFKDETNAADFDDSLAQISKAIDRGVTTFFVSAGAFTQSIDDLPRICAHVRRRFDELG